VRRYNLKNTNITVLAPLYSTVIELGRIIYHILAINIILTLVFYISEIVTGMYKNKILFLCVDSSIVKAELVILKLDEKFYIL